jgi:ribosomal protein S18 acetylase RimI-like enzyme
MLMSAIEVRQFRRTDRDQLTQLVNAHAAAVIPGVGASVSAVLSALERQPGEFIEDPWVSHRITLVAEQASRIAAAAHLLRYHPDERAGVAARNVGEIRWLLFWPEAPAGNPYWPAAQLAAEALMVACIGQLEAWGVTRQEAGGELPVPGVYGVPEQWPHVSELYEQAGFIHAGHTEVVYLAAVEQLEISDEGERQSRNGGLADVGNLHVAEQHRRRGVGRWLLSQAADWLSAADVDRLLSYAWLEGTDPGGRDYADDRAFLRAAGFQELTRTRRGWIRSPHQT